MEPFRRRDMKTDQLTQADIDALLVSDESVEISESELLVLEQYSRDKELEFFTRHQVPEAYVMLQGHIQEILVAISDPTLGEASDLMNADVVYVDIVDIPRATGMEDRSDPACPGALKGRLGLVGPFIVHAELEVKLKKFNRGNPFKTTIQPSTPWLLSQLQSAKNYCQLAVQELSELARIGAGLDNPNRSPSISARHVMQVVDAAGSFIKRAREELLYPSKTSFPRALYSPSIFNPRIPGNLVLEFSIREGKLMVSAFVLEPISKPVTSSLARGANDVSAVLNPVGRHYYYRKEWVEVKYHVEVMCEFPELTRSVNGMHRAFLVCSDLRDKAVALQRG